MKINQSSHSFNNAATKATLPLPQTKHTFISHTHTHTRTHNKLYVDWIKVAHAHRGIGRLNGNQTFHFKLNLPHTHTHTRVQSRKTGAAFAPRRNQFFPAAAEEEEADCREKRRQILVWLKKVASAACQFCFIHICTAVELYSTYICMYTKLRCSKWK